NLASRTERGAFLVSRPPLAFCFSPDGQLLAVATGQWNKSGDVILYDTRTTRERVVLRGHTSIALSVAFSPDSATLASGSDDRTVRLWDVAPGRERAVLEGHEDLVRALAFAPDGRTLTSVSWDGTVKIWDTLGGHERATFEWHTGMINTVAI